MVLEGMKDLAVLEAPDPQPRHHLNGGRGGSGVLLTPARRRAAIAHLTSTSSAYENSAAITPTRESNSIWLDDIPAERPLPRTTGVLKSAEYK